jgi:signal transduction histidine kinase
MISHRGWRLAPLDLAWTAFVVVMLGCMWLLPRAMTVPYHFAFVSFGLVYGFRCWSATASAVILGALTVLTGVIFVRALVNGYVSADELAEIPLMPLIVAFMVWHALRSATAQHQVEDLAARESSRLDRQREFLRDTSHAIRTPVTIARGHVELVRMAADDEELRADTAVVLHQLDRLNDLAGRLLAIEGLETLPVLASEPVDIASLVHAVGRRWQAAVERRWQVDVAPTGVAEADALRLEEAVDAFVENALRFTGPGDVVRISCRQAGSFAVIEVADSGPGIADDDLPRVFDRFFHRAPPDGEPGSGLGLALVSAVATAHGGAVAAGRAPEGGALMSLRVRIALPGPGVAPPGPRHVPRRVASTAG